MWSCLGYLLLQGSNRGCYGRLYRLYLFTHLVRFPRELRFIVNAKNASRKYLRWLHCVGDRPRTFHIVQ